MMSYSAYKRRIVFISAGVTLFFMLTANVHFPGGALSFLQWAEAIVSGQSFRPFYQRDIGYSLLLLATGYTWHHSLLPLMAVQAGMAFSMPLLVFTSVGPLYPLRAYVTALISIASLVPYLMIKLIHHDQPYIFLTLLACCQWLIFCRSQRIATLYKLTIIGFLVSIMRPAGNYLYPLLWLLCCTIKIRGRYAMHLLLCAIVFLLATEVNYLYRHHAMHVKSGESMPSYVGSQVFFNLYMNSRNFGITLSPSLGEHMQTIDTELANALREDKTELQHVWTEPSYERIEYMQNAVASLEHNSPLFLGASWEIAKAYPWYPFAYTGRNLWYLMIDPHVYPRFVDTADMKAIKPDFIPHISVVNTDGQTLPSPANEEVRYQPTKEHMRWLSLPFKIVKGLWKEAWYRTFTIALFALTITGMLNGLYMYISSNPSTRILAKRLLLPALGIAAITFYNALVIAAMVDAAYRYQYVFILPELILASNLYVGLVHTWRHHRLNCSKILSSKMGFAHG